MDRDRSHHPEEGEDRRAAHWKLTTAGGARLKRAGPHWKAAQESVQGSCQEHKRTFSPYPFTSATVTGGATIMDLLSESAF